MDAFAAQVSSPFILTGPFTCSNRKYPAKKNPRLLLTTLILPFLFSSSYFPVRGDLIRILNRLLKRKSKLDAIMIETTGLADPAPVAQTFFVDEDLSSQLRLDAILTLVDAKHVIPHLDEEKPDGAVNEAMQQVAFADKILLNKLDLVSDSEKENVIERIREINRSAKIIECRNADVPLEAILEQHAFDLDKILAADPSFLQLEEDDHHHHHDGEEKDCKACAAGDHDHHHHHHNHDDHHHEGGEKDCKACAAGEDHKEHTHGHKHKHHHDTRVSSVGIEIEGSLNFGKFNQWLGKLVQEKGADIYRCKGILAMAGSEDRFVFHGVHMMIQMGHSGEGLGRPWQEGEKRMCRAVFIGKELDRAMLTDGFKSCLAVQTLPDNAVPVYSR
jgi:G3E family GTPase